MYRATYRDDAGDWWVLEGSESYDREWAKVFAKDTGVTSGMMTALEVYEDPDPHADDVWETPELGPGWFVERTYSRFALLGGTAPVEV